MRVRGERGRGVWRFNLGYSSSLEVMEGNRRTFEALSIISRPKLLTKLNT